MNKLNLYTIKFPCKFENLDKAFEKSQFINLIKKRSNYLDFEYSLEKIVEESYTDLQGNINYIKRLNTQKIYFRIYDIDRNNLLIFNQPRSILNFKNHLSKVFNFDFFILKENLDIKFFLNKNKAIIDYISKIEIKNILYKDNIFGNHYFYTQNPRSDLLELINSFIPSESFVISKCELNFKGIPNRKIILTSDHNFHSKDIIDDNTIKFIYDTLSDKI